MIRSLYLGWRYIVRHRLKAGILVASITVIFYLPGALSQLVAQSAEGLTARAIATPLMLGARGSPLELTLSSLYFQSRTPQLLRFGALSEIDSELARSIPLYVRFKSRQFPIVGTNLEYLEFRGLRLRAGRRFAVLGECVVGSSVAEELELAPGRTVVSSPETVFDLAGTYPLEMNVVGVLEPTGTPDDQAIFVDIKTTWIIEGLGHGHQDLESAAAASAVLARNEGSITANASLVEFNRITDANRDSFHFHGDLSEYPISAAVAIPHEQKSGVMLEGRLQQHEQVQIIRPVDVMNELLATVFTVQRYVIAAIVLVGAATVATTVLVFLLSYRLRREEIDTLTKIGGSRSSIALVVGSEVIFVLLLSSLLAFVATELTSFAGTWMLVGLFVE
ncbi:MAG: ABC transporter permease [Gammaproteobacteria bacterium]|nr:ABC transporter permease [Gammaproteobacteria bacterium]